MATWYVGTGGIDGVGRGTNAGDPFLTWVYAMAASASADTIVGADTFDSNEVGFVNINTKAKILQGAGTGTVVQSDGTLRVLYVGTSSPVTISDLTLYDRDATAAGSSRLLERNSPSGTCTVSRVYFDNGRYQAVWNRPDAAGITLNDCTFLSSISSNYAFLSMSDGGAGCVVNRLTASTTSTPTAVYIMHQLDAWDTGATMSINDSTITFGGSGSLVRAILGGHVTPVASGNIVYAHANQNIPIVNCDRCDNEVITGNLFFIPSTNSYDAIYLTQIGGGASLATVSNNTIYQYNNANHVIIFGNEVLTSLARAYDGSICSGNKVYCGGYFGLGTGTVHGLMGAYNSVYFKRNQVYGASLAIVLKDFGVSNNDTYCNDNLFVNNYTAFRIKGVTNSNIIGNKVISNNGENEYTYSITDNLGGDDATGTKLYNNVVDIDHGLVYFGDTASLADITSDYNFYSLRDSALFASAGMTTLTSWQAGRGQDLHSGHYNPAQKHCDIFSDTVYNWVMSETFQNALKTRDNGTIIANAGLIRDNGLELNGTDQYAYRNITCLRASAFATNNELQIEMEFTPDFAYDANSTRYLFSAGTDYYLVKMNNAGSNVLRLYLGGTSIVDIASATYGSYWLVGQKNKIIIASRGTATASTDVYLNGTKIVDAENSAWTRTTQTVLNFGSDSSGANVFDGNFHSFKIGTRKFTTLEVSKISTNTSLVLPFAMECPMTTALHDVANTRSLDVTGNGNHLVFGAGAATPTKLTTVGYSSDGGDYLRTASNPLTPNTLTMCCFFKAPNSSSATQAFFDYTDSTNTGNRGGVIMYSSGGLIRFYVGAAAAANAATLTLGQSYQGGLYFVVGCYDGTDVKIWVNGIKGANAATPIAPVYNANSKFSLFARANGTTSPCAAGSEVYYASAGAFVITDTQVKYLTNKITNMLNLI